MDEKFKKTKFGIFPFSWKTISLYECIDTIKGGGTPSRHEPEYWNGNIPWASIKDLSNNAVNTTKESISEIGLSNSSSNLIPARTIVIGTRMAVGVIKRFNVPVAINQDLKALFPKSNLLDDYLYFYIQKQQNKLKSLGIGSTVSGICLEDIKSLPIPLPSLPEQKKIARILSTWDKAIEKLEKLIELKEQRKKGVMQQLIEIKCSNWHHERVDYLFKSISDKKHTDEELLSVTQDRGVIPRSMLEGKVMSPEGDVAGYKMIKQGDFVVSLRSFQGGLEYSNYQGLISPAYTVLRPQKEIDTEFYRHFFKSYIFINKYLAIAVVGIRDGKQISFSDFVSVKLPIPSLQELVNLRKALKQQYNLPVREEIHASELIRINKIASYREIHKNERIDILRKIVNEIPQIFRHAKVLNICLDKNEITYAENHGYAKLAWSRLIQRYDTYLKKEKCKGIIITDDTDEPMIRQLLRKMRIYNPVPSKYNNDFYNCVTDNIIEDPFLRDSRHSYLVQIADVISYVLFRHEYPKSSLKKYNIDKLFSILKPVLLTEAALNDEFGIVRR